jgi:serralysin
MDLSASEQLFLELVNRARLDPLAEAARQRIDLNEGLAAGRIDGTAKQVLAADHALEYAARLHSQWMLAADVFSHTGEGGSTLRDRIQDSGYLLAGAWRIGENLSWTGTTGEIDLTAAAVAHHNRLYASATHRVNLMNGEFRETGIGQEQGVFTDGRDWNASMLTQVFAVSNARQFITGVVIDDRDGDRFYDVGEGIGGARIATNGQTVTTTAAGAYSIAVAPADSVWVGLTLDGITRNVWVDTRPGNVKLDMLSNGAILTSGSVTLGYGATDAMILGVAGRALTGNDSANRLAGNSGNDFLQGGAGNDTLSPGAGNDTVWGGSGDDRVTLTSGNNEVWAGPGQDTVIGGTGHDTLGGGDGDDLLDARAGGRNQLWGGDGQDTLHAADGGDMAGGGWGDDMVHGGAAADTLMGGLGNDTLEGNAGNDMLYLGAGNDIGRGGAGNDTLFAGPGFDQLWGGAGADRFEFWRGHGWNRIEDFNPAEGDVLALGRGLWTQTHGVMAPGQMLSAFASLNTSGDTVLNFADAGTSIVLVGVGSIANLEDHILIL